jgi:c-di-GMP-binding flagellar brake protein YcgR
MTLITPFPEAESPALERFALLGREPVAALLRELGDRKTLVTFYYEEASGFTVGRVLDVDVERDAVIVDCAGDAGVQQAIARATPIVAVGFLDSTKVQFTLANAEPVDRQGHAAFRFLLPTRALRIQRRNAPRRHPPGGRPAVCRVPVPAGGAPHEALNVLDISSGGIALLATPRTAEFARDQVLDPCYLDLPEIGQIVVSLKVRYVEAWPAEGGGRRCGCEFIDLAGGARRALEVYLERLEESRPQDTGRRAA